jgi:hypothetical protein
MKEKFNLQGMPDYWYSASFFCLCMIIISTFSCKNVDSPSANHFVDTTPQQNDSVNNCISSKLETLYLQNDPGNPQLDSIINQTGSKNKLIVQFRIDRTQKKFTLGIWPSKSKNQNIDTNRMQVLKIKPSPAAAGMDLMKDFSYVFMGDQQIGGKTYFILKTHVNDPAYRYIIFKPRIIPGNHVIYDISATGSLETDGDMIGSTNPSPPKDAF